MGIVRRPLPLGAIVIGWSIALVGVATTVSSIAWLGMLTWGLGLLAIAAAANNWPQRGTDMRSRRGVAASGGQLVVSVAAGFLAGLGAVSMFGASGALVGGLVTAAVADLLPAAIQEARSVSVDGDESARLGWLLALSVAVSATLGFYAIQLQ